MVIVTSSKLRLLVMAIAVPVLSLHVGRTSASSLLQGARVSDSIITKAMIAKGDSIFHGKLAGGLCFTCHGPDAKGIAGLGPNLTDEKWLHGDGSYGFIVGLVEKGVPKPKQAATPMLPKGGSNLNAEQIRAVAAYVYSLSHKIP
jgi:mono/diheme cytochrome c family protein